MTDWREAFDKLPEGVFYATYQGSIWRAVKSSFANGRSRKLVAEEAGGPGYLSLNIYLLTDGRALLKPCEIPEAAALAFICGAVPVGAPERADRS